MPMTEQEIAVKNQEWACVVALAGLHPEDVTAVMAGRIEELLKHYTPEAAAPELRSILGATRGTRR